MFWAVKLTENVDGDKYTCSGDSHPFFLFPNFNFGKYVIVLGVDNSALSHIDKTKRYFSPCSRSNTKSDDTTITAEAKYSINFIRSKRKFV